MLSLQHDGGQKIVKFLAITHPISELGWTWAHQDLILLLVSTIPDTKQKGYEQATKVKLFIHWYLEMSA